MLPYEFSNFADTLGQYVKEVTKLTRLGREIVIALMLVGMLVGSAIASYGIAASHLEGGIWDFLARIAPIGFVVALARQVAERQVRHMTAAVGHPTLRLLRVRIGQFALGDLPPGRWRELTAAERAAVLA